MTATHTRLTACLLGHRIDAMYYRPDYVANDARLRTSGLHVVSLGSLVKSGRRAVYFRTSTLDDTAAPSDWVPFLTADDLGPDGFFLQLNARRRVSPEFALRYPKGMLRANELLVKVKGPNQITAYNEEEPDRAVLVSGTIWGATVRCESVDPYYLVGALSCPYAAMARSRLRTNLNVEFLSPMDLAAIDLPLPRSREAQKYIGDKVRQAGRLMAAARLAEDRIRDAHLALVPQSLARPDSSRKTRRVTPALMTERLDAHFYPAAVEEFFAEYSGHVAALGDVCELITNGQTRPESQRDDAVAQATVANLSPSFLRGIHRQVAPIQNKSRFLREHDILFCNAAHNKAYVGHDLTYVHANDSVLPSTEVMVVRVNRAVVPASFVRAFLLTPIGYLELQSTIRGITAHSYACDVKVLRIPLPKVDPSLRQSWFDLDCQLAHAGLQTELGGRLVRSVAVLIESMIDGSLNEQELLAAQREVERGDQTLDRRILSRLTEGGIDLASSPPIFPDLDILYTAIEETRGADSADGGTR